MMRRERSSTFLVSVLIFLFIGEIQATKLQKNCSTSCGDINNIRYPFGLKDDPAICGDTNFQLSCQSNKTILEFPSAGRYYVKEISYKENIIRVVDVNLGTGTCRLPSGSLSEEDKRNLPSSQLISVRGLDYFGESDHNMMLQVDGSYCYATFSRCSQRINDTRFTAIPCLSENQSYFYVSIDMRYQYPFCSSEAVTPILCWSEYELMSNKVPYETISESLQSGFNLTWYFDDACRLTVGTEIYYYSCRKLDFKTRLYDFIQSLWENIYYLLYESILWPCDRFAAYKSDFMNGYMNMGYLIGELLQAVVRVVLICRFIGAPIVLIVYLICKYRKTRQTVDNVEKFLHNQQSWMPKRYAYAELVAVTNNFKEKLGQGGFGSVYRGQLHNGSLIAVKMLENSKFSAEEFINEVSTIGRIHHVNIVQLVGFSSEESKRALVYEYMPNGSLDKQIFSKPGKSLSFSWEKLCEIALAIARGIEYLHRGCDVCILHFDIKPHNILLDQNFTPKVSDFGLAKFYPKENDFVSVSATKGTIGYIAPELISRNFGKVSNKSDVYSFGMLLLEMVGGRKNSDMRVTDSSKAYFPSWVYDQINIGEDLELQHVTEHEMVIAKKLCLIGLWCIQVKPSDRPSITKVIEMLEGNIDNLQLPPKPFFSSSSPENVSIKVIQSNYSTDWSLSESTEEYSCKINVA
ncbi:LEAF RUST 10 DISEASE-RESISTANCE LOCUS RECEPTOR-LIKE PROTEIN KINASE-like 2.1 [Mangifera indica]|uniref:LEAF RUST 10 DISEASE-RESISTANCE LOCUS RECEPTOR-LIKE PROTEIN KINASE-like 2.1 n=1 Tax=Mangifera indica TaxID=29780 RepID=UPI001CFA0B15|nr:LEAF RUST 10 DISEASE-RESISTANCE LOCUS RECEPTOR-LIKE PROTEIN KINASE-like 2.1 [Mangifera indica]